VTKRPFKLVDSKDPPTDVVECLRSLLEQAERGQIIGIAFAAMLKSRGYVCHTAGEAHRSVTYTRGMIMALDDQLAGRVREGG
jgi:hypothetical protein